MKPAWVAGLGVTAFLVFLIVRLGVLATLQLLVAVRDLGPISGWRCAESGTYTYDPRRERADSALLAEPPESVLSGVDVEKVEADLRGGDTVVWTHVSGADPGKSEPVGSGGERRVYVLSPGRLQTLTSDFDPRGPTAICNAYLGAWQITAEHAVG
jgi:hypothetical protein